MVISKIVSQEDVTRSSKELHNYMRDYAKLSENEKPLMVSAVLIALWNGKHQFAPRYPKCKTPKDIAELMLSTVETALRDGGGLSEDKIGSMLSAYSFISTHPELTKAGTEILLNIIKMIEKTTFTYVSGNHEVDVLGQFYGEFLKYTGGDKKGLGIVLTPKHIAELFCELAKVDKDSIVLDPCSGTGGFLIAALKNMLDSAGTDNEKREQIKRSQLIGIEHQPHMFVLLAANMILRGDGKSNLYQGDCFDKTIVSAVKGEHKPTVGFINPPYSQKGESLSELDFIDNMLDMLDVGGIGIAIVPMSSAIGTAPSFKRIKKRLLSKHTLDAVMSMPDELFYPVGVNTCIMVFRAGIPHDSKVSSWFGYWKNDGFEKTKVNGRVDLRGLWRGIQDDWLSAFRERREVLGMSVRHPVSEEDEWCAEAYMETDYSSISEEDFKREVKRYAIFLATEGMVEDA